MRHIEISGEMDKEIRERKFSAISKLYKGGLSPIQHVEDLASIIAWAYSEEDSTAIRIANDFGLDYLDICAIRDDVGAYINEINEDNEFTKGENRYYDNHH